MNTSDKRRFGGISRLFGPKAFEILNHSHVVVVGVGGVGSWVAEALARTAVGHITLIDGDTVEESNTNRQLPALNGTYGQKKVEVLARRLQAINPEARIDIVDRFVGEDNFDELIPACDAIIDCIDSLSAKLFWWQKLLKKHVLCSLAAERVAKSMPRGLVLPTLLMQKATRLLLLCALGLEKSMDSRK